MPRTDKTKPRLYLDVPLTPGKLIGLERGQSNYLANVLRKKTGEQVVLFNGADGAWLASIALLGRKAVTVETLDGFWGV